MRPEARFTAATADPADQFRSAHAERYREWLRAAQAWSFGGQEIAEQLGPYLVLVHSSEGNPEKHLLPLMQDVRTFGGFPMQGGGSAVGTYRGVEIWILHHFMGCTAAQLWMECLTNTAVRHVIGLAEMTAYPDHVRVGDIVLPAVAVRGDLITNFHAPPEVPATADGELLARLADQLRTSTWPVHVGPVYSGMPGGIGIHNPILRDKIWRHMQAGLLGNAIEVSVTYLEAARLGVRAAEAWVVSDDIAYGRMQFAPDGTDRWQHGWSLIGQASLNVLADISHNSP
jgi:purine-nucleoside phosphorylase